MFSLTMMEWYLFLILKNKSFVLYSSCSEQILTRIGVLMEWYMVLVVGVAIICLFVYAAEAASAMWKSSDKF